MPRVGSDARLRMRGFSLLELAAVIAIIAVLSGYAIERLWGVQVDAERTAMETIVGALQSALGMKVAEAFLAGDKAGLAALADSNPMERLSETPKNYLGVMQDVDAAGIRGGQWYFDLRARVLVYRVYNSAYFRGGAGEPARARFAVRLELDALRSDGRGQDVVGARLVVIEPYAWTERGP